MIKASKRSAVLGMLLVFTLLVSGCNIIGAKVGKGTVSGTVVHLLTGDFLTSGVIRISEFDIDAQIGADGKYVLENVPAGTHQLRVESDGATYNASVTIRPTQNIVKNIEVLNGRLTVIDDFEDWDGSGDRYLATTGGLVEPTVALSTNAKNGQKAGSFAFPAWTGWSVINTYPAEMTEKVGEIDPTHFAFWINIEELPSVGVAVLKIRVESPSKQWYRTGLEFFDTGWQLVQIPISEFDDDEWGEGNSLTLADTRSLHGYSVIAQWPDGETISFIFDDFMALELY